MNTRGLPAFLSWSIPEPGIDLYTWQDGRCAMCGDRHWDLVTDHDHLTGLVRGMLCRSCNRLEGQSWEPIVVYWNAGCHPARLLGLEVEYRSGWGAPPVDEQPTRLQNRLFAEYLVEALAEAHGRSA